MKLILLSDIHGNLSALQSVIEDFTKKYEPDGIILLGDIINYGMRPNEVIETLISLKVSVIGNIFGNHEKALLDGDTSHFSTERGKRMLEYTRSVLKSKSLDYIRTNCASSGFMELILQGKRILLVHGNAENPYWGKLNDTTVSNPIYSEYDYVISGHSHIPQFIEKFYECESPEFRNRKRTIFINPGSVGQPRNHNPRAQYAFFDLTEEIVHFNSVRYNIALEQSLYPESLDSFYSERLTNGI